MFTGEGNRLGLLQKDVTLMSISLDETETWRTNFLQEFWLFFEILPVYRAEIHFHQKDQNILLGITSAGDIDFTTRLVDVEKDIEEQTDLVCDIHNIRGGVGAFRPDFEASQFYLPQAYDQQAPLKQWMSQKPLGLQTVIQFEMEKTTDVIELSALLVKDAIKQTLVLMKEDGITDFDMREMAIIGDGCVIVSFWLGGNVIVIWDGNTHIDINLFITSEDFDMSLYFKEYLQEQIPGLVEQLSDEQPRGYGRVVNFSEDVESYDIPHWAIMDDTNQS